MLKSNVDIDGFEKVISKRFSKNKQTKIPSKGTKFEKQDTEIDIEKSKRRIYSAVDELRISKYLEDVSKSVSTILQTRKVVEIVCFGLGHIGECNISRYQLAFLLCLKDSLCTEKVLVHDPIFYTSECVLLQQLGLEVISQNSEGSYIISEQDLTLVYLPHCPKQLTNNFLWSNWGTKLQNCILICNSFSSLKENQPSRLLRDTVPYIHRVIPYTCELLLVNHFRFTDIFNDTSVHHFPKENFDKVDSEFWRKGEKPEYKDSEEFITSLMVEKLII